MKKVSSVASLALLFVILASTSLLAQMEMSKTCRHEMKMMGEGMMSQGKCGQHSGGMMHQMGCCKMGQEMKMCKEEGMGCCMREFFLCCKKELELSDKQVNDLKSIKMDFLKNRLKTEADLKIAQLELKSLMDEDKTSLKEIESKLRSVEKLKTGLKLSHIKAFREAKALLTPEQMEKMKKCHEM